MPTKCDIIRDSARANACGLCKAAAEGAAVPAACLAYDPPPNPAACKVSSAANVRLYLFASRAAPPAHGQIARDERAAVIANYENDLASTEQALIDAYRVDAEAATIGWPDFERCLWNPDGLPGGIANRRYFGRADVVQQGFNPSYPLGGELLHRAVWSDDLSDPSPLPLSVDYLANPDLFAILVMAFLVVVLGALVWRALRATRRADRAEELASARDPGPLDPRAEECREYVETLESQGFDMGYYRRRCGLGPSPPP